MEIRLVVNGNLVHTAVVPRLQLVASRVSGTSEGLWEPGAPKLREGTDTVSSGQSPCVPE